MEIEVASKPPLMADGCVPSWLKILTYRRERSVFKPARALLSTLNNQDQMQSPAFKRGPQP